MNCSLEDLILILRVLLVVWIAKPAALGMEALHSSWSCLSGPNLFRTWRNHWISGAWIGSTFVCEWIKLARKTSNALPGIHRSLCSRDWSLGFGSRAISVRRHCLEGCGCHCENNGTLSAFSCSSRRANRWNKRAGSNGHPSKCALENFPDRTMEDEGTKVDGARFTIFKTRNSLPVSLSQHLKVMRSVQLNSCCIVEDWRWAFPEKWRTLHLTLQIWFLLW